MNCPNCHKPMKKSPPEITLGFMGDEYYCPACDTRKIVQSTGSAAGNPMVIVRRHLQSTAATD